jgi:hypothetical protein
LHLESVDLHPSSHIRFQRYRSPFFMYITLTHNPFIDITFSECGPGSSVGIATGYGLYDPGSNLGGGEIFRTCPDRPWGPPSLLSNGYRFIPGCRKRPGRDADPHPLLVPRCIKQSSAIPLLSLRAFVACKKGETYLHSLNYASSYIHTRKTKIHTFSY